MSTQFSPIQNHILSVLKNARKLRYRDMQPEGVANDLFNYHLQHLVKKDFVLRDEEGYALSPLGIKHVADPYPENDRITSLFKINVLTVVSRMGESGLEILNQIRMSNPSYGKVGVMGGVVWKGEDIATAASRKLLEETGLVATFRVIGCERRMMYQEGELFSDVVFPIAYSDMAQGELREETEFGKNFWVPIDEAIVHESVPYDSIKALGTVLHALKQGGLAELPFFFTEEVQVDEYKNS